MTTNEWKVLLYKILDTMDNGGKVDVLTDIMIMTESNDLNWACTDIHNELCDEGEDLLNPSKE